MSKSEVSPNSVWSSGPMLIGYFLTLGICIFWWKVAYLPPATEPDCHTKICEMFNSAPNAIGDTFAGFFSSLAFVWIVVTVFMQGVELREQRLEFQKIAISQDQQVKLMIKQGEIFEREQRERAEISAGRVLDAEANRFLEGVGTVVIFHKSGTIHGAKLNFEFEKQSSIDQNFLKFRDLILELDNEDYEEFESSVNTQILITELNSLLAMKVNLSSDQVSRLKWFKLDELIAKLESMKSAKEQVVE